MNNVPQNTISSSHLDMRDAIFNTLYDIAKEDSRVILLSDDQGAMKIEDFKRNLKNQYFNMGISEQNIISVASGLALEGKLPFVYGISTFMTQRSYEQIRLDLCGMNLPVTILASGPGLTYGSDGPTHHAVQDISIMRALPNMSIFSPCDLFSTCMSVKMAFEQKGPAYIRLEKGILPNLYRDPMRLCNGFYLLKPSRNILLISTGIMTHTAMQLSDRMDQQGTPSGVLDLYQIKPIREQLLIDLIREYERIVILEEHTLIGGIGSLIAELMADAGLIKPLLRLGLLDQHSYEYGNRLWLQERAGLGVSQLTDKILKWGKDT